jgi:adenylate cyclase
VLGLPQNLNKQGVDTGVLIAWRKQADIYPKISFADVFAKAEGARQSVGVPSFKGKVVVIGSTASSLHDIHPTPLASFQAGVESLATAADNALNGHFTLEVPRWLQALIALSLCVGMAFWVRKFGIASLDGALVVLPGALLGISYLSLNLLPVFVDLQLAAGAVLLFLAALRTWNNFRRNYWCGMPSPAVLAEREGADCALLALQSPENKPFADTGLDHLIDWLEQEAPQCRVAGGDTTANWPVKLRWPELARLVGIVGPMHQLQHLQACLPAGMTASVPLLLAQPVSKASIASTFTHRFFRSNSI